MLSIFIEDYPNKGAKGKTISLLSSKLHIKSLKKIKAIEMSTVH